MNKTVIQVYKQNFQDKDKIQLEIGQYDIMAGLGDCIRGTITLYKLSKIYGFNLIIDFRYHPIGNYIDTKNLEHANDVNNNIDDVKFIFYLHNLKNYILNNNNNIIYLHTNAWYDDKDIYNTNTINSMLEDEQNFMKNIFKPNNILNEIIVNRYNNYNNYNIIHFRLGDNGLIHQNNISNEELIKFENIFNKYYEKNDILICDNIIFKNYIKSKYNVNTLDIEICHLGNTSNINCIEGTLIDFFIQSKANKIKSYSIYYWISGFIHWNAKIYNIPIEIMN